MTLVRASPPGDGKRHFPIDDASEKRKVRGRRQSVWVVMRNDPIAHVGSRITTATPLLVCASHGVACKKIRDLRKSHDAIDVPALFTLAEVPLMKVMD